METVGEGGGFCKRVVVGVQLLGDGKGEPERGVETGDAEADEGDDSEFVRPGVEDRRDWNEVSLLALWTEIHLGVVLNGVTSRAGLMGVSRRVAVV